MFLINCNQPCWYKLSVAENGLNIIISISEDFLKRARKIPSNAPIVLDYKKEFQLKKFNGTFESDFGFDHSLQLIKQELFWRHFLVMAPKFQESRCDSCNGTGKNPNFKDECINCSGTGKDNHIDWNKSFALSASLSVLFSFLNFTVDPSEIKTDHQEKQCLIVSTITQRGMHGGSLGGYISESLRKFLNTKDLDLAKSKNVMGKIYTHMTGFSTDGYLSRTNAYTKDQGALILDCPGDACGIHPSSWSEIAEGNGYNFACHNVDTPIQQITLISGLAAICDEYYKAKTAD